MTLHEVARELGVETQIYGESDGSGKPLTPNYPRPDLEIAHEVLAKLPTGEWPKFPEWAIGYNGGGDSWWWTWEETDNRGTFIECVVALAERYIKERKT